jgi:hypothetical protein
MVYTPQNNVTNYYGVNISDFTGTSLSRALNLNLSSGTNKFNIYAGGTASNYLAGSLLIGTTTDSGYKLDVNGTGRFSNSLYVFNGNIISRNDTSSTYRGLSIGATIADNTEYAYIKYQPNTGDLQIWGSPASFGGKTTFYNNNIQWLNVSSTNALSFTGAATFSSTLTTGGTIAASGQLYLKQDSTTASQIIISGLTDTNKQLIIGYYTTGNGYSSIQSVYQTVGYTPLLLNPNGGNVGIGTASLNASAKLQVDSTTQGFLPPRMTSTQRLAISSPAAGLIVFDTTTLKSYTYDGTTWNAHY